MDVVERKKNGVLGCNYVSVGAIVGISVGAFSVSGGFTKKAFTVEIVVK